MHILGYDFDLNNESLNKKMVELKDKAEKLQKHREQIIRAKQNYVTCTADQVLFDAVYIQYCILNNLPILSSLAQDSLTKEIKLDDYEYERGDIAFEKFIR